MAIKVLGLKSFTGNPADGIDNFTLAVFGRLLFDKVEFFASASDDFQDKGAIRKINKSKIGFLINNRPDYLWGTGNIKELFFLFFKPRRTKYIINFHTILLRGSKLWKVRTPWFLRRLLFSKADKIICPSEFSAQSVKKYFPNIHVVGILNGVDLNLFSPDKTNKKYLEEKYQVNFSKPLVVFVGTFQLRKRPDLFIEVAKNCSEANFIAVGKEIPPNDFLTGAKGLKNFKWIEKMPREDIAILFSSSKIFVFPSLNEPSAAVILEAMASGCIPVISKSGGNPEFLKDGESGFLIDTNFVEKEEFIKKIDLLIKDDGFWRKISKNSRIEAEKHSLDKVAQEYQSALFSR